MRRRSVVLVGGGLALAVSLSACSGSGSDAGAPTTSKQPSPPTTAPPDLVWSATSTGEHDVNGNYRQGLARSGDGWIFVTNNAIYRTDGAFRQTAAHLDAIPADLAAQGYDHLGDPDIADGTISIPVEKEDKESGEQVTARYDEESLEFIDSVVVAQHHNSFVAVDDDGTRYSTDEFSDDAILRYRIVDGKQVMDEPLEMSRSVERIQGGDIADGAIWLSTDDDHNGVYRVDLQTGAVTDLGGAGHTDGEGEGIDATDLPGGLLHVLVADEAIAPMWVIDLDVASKPA